MALSNWDTLAVNEKGEATGGSFVSKLGVEVEIYKNWLYVRDPKAWQDGGDYVEPTVMQINSGDLTYKDVHIHAERGPKEGVYCVVWSCEYPKQEKDQPPLPAIYSVMVGIGCYGYVGEEWVGVEEVERKHLQDILTRKEHYSFTMDGVEHLSSVDVFEAPIRNISLEKALRFNQGDAYFADKIGFDLPTTEPGQSEPTVLSQMLK